MGQEPEKGRIFNPDARVILDPLEHDISMEATIFMVKSIREKTIEEIRALVAAEQMDATEYHPCPEGTCGRTEYIGYTLDAINRVLDKAKLSRPLWEK